MRKYIAGLVAGLLLALPLTAGAWVNQLGVEDSPVGFEVTEAIRVVRVFNADAGEWITEIWPARCTVFEDGSARCPSYFD
jgi:hypothetical protein